MKSLRRNMVTKTVDPEGPFLEKWNNMVLICCVIAVCIDPLLSYIYVVDAHRLCLYLDQHLAITFYFLRTLVDVFYFTHIFLKFRTGFIYASGEVVKDSRSIIKRYLQTYFIVDILSILPLPQVVTVIAIRAKLGAIRIRPFTILTIAQNLVRVVRMLPLLHQVTRTSRISTAWAGAASNFFFYLLASHVIGSFWYMTSIERADRCWRLACANNNHHCNFDDLYCGRGRDRPDQDQGHNSFLNASCSPLQPSASLFHYGIFLDALDIQLYPDFFRRFFYCFVWGLRNLSSLGQNLKTSNHIAENLFVVFIFVTGLILFSLLAGNIQRYLQCLTAGKDKMMMKLRDHEEWMSASSLPLDLRARIRQHELYKWQNKRGVDQESLIRDLP